MPAGGKPLRRGGAVVGVSGGVLREDGEACARADRHHQGLQHPRLPSCPPGRDPPGEGSGSCGGIPPRLLQRVRGHDQHRVSDVQVRRCQLDLVHRDVCEGPGRQDGDQVPVAGAEVDQGEGEHADVRGGGGAGEEELLAAALLQPERGEGGREEMERRRGQDASVPSASAVSGQGPRDQLPDSPHPARDSLAAAPDQAGGEAGGKRNGAGREDGAAAGCDGAGADSAHRTARVLPADFDAQVPAALQPAQEQRAGDERRGSGGVDGDGAEREREAAVGCLQLDPLLLLVAALLRLPQGLRDGHGSGHGGGGGGAGGAAGGAGEHGVGAVAGGDLGAGAGQVVGTGVHGAGADAVLQAAEDRGGPAGEHPEGDAVEAAGRQDPAGPDHDAGRDEDGGDPAARHLQLHVAVHADLPDEARQARPRALRLLRPARGRAQARQGRHHRRRLHRGRMAGGGDRRAEQEEDAEDVSEAAGMRAGDDREVRAMQEERDVSVLVQDRDDGGEGGGRSAGEEADAAAPAGGGDERGGDAGAAGERGKRAC
eukprot:764893-Hanusia_phi.AAC.3